MEGIYYKGNRIGVCQIYSTLSPFYEDKKLGRLQFNGLEALMTLLMAPDTDEVSCAYWGKEEIKDFKQRLEKMNFCIYLSPDAEHYHEGVGTGIKKRIDTTHKGNSKQYDQVKPEEGISKENAGGLSEATRKFLRDSFAFGNTIEDRILIAFRYKQK